MNVYQKLPFAEDILSYWVGRMTQSVPLSCVILSIFLPPQSHLLFLCHTHQPEPESSAF